MYSIFIENTPIEHDINSPSITILCETTKSSNEQLQYSVGNNQNIDCSHPVNNPQTVSLEKLEVLVPMVNSEPQSVSPIFKDSQD